MISIKELGQNGKKASSALLALSSQEKTKCY